MTWVSSGCCLDVICLTHENEFTLDGANRLEFRFLFSIIEETRQQRAYDRFEATSPWRSAFSRVDHWLAL